MEAPEPDRAEHPTPIAVLPAWTYDPHTVWRSRGFSTSNLYIYEGAVAAEPRNMPRWIASVPRVVYQWRVAVVQRIVCSYHLDVAAMTTLLVDGNGKLGSIAVRPGRSLAPALQKAGFEVVVDTIRGWETPHPILTSYHPELDGMT